MSWVAVGVTGASALMSSQQARAQQKQQKAQNMAAAAQTEYSPWTKMGAGQIQTGAPDPTAAALQGGLTGFMQGQNIKAGMAKAEAPVEDVKDMGTMSVNTKEMPTMDPLEEIKKRNASSWKIS